MTETGAEFRSRVETELTEAGKLGTAHSHRIVPQNPPGLFSQVSALIHKLRGSRRWTRAHPPSPWARRASFAAARCPPAQQPAHHPQQLRSKGCHQHALLPAPASAAARLTSDDGHHCHHRCQCPLHRLVDPAAAAIRKSGLRKSEAAALRHGSTSVVPVAAAALRPRAPALRAAGALHPAGSTGPRPDRAPGRPRADAQDVGVQQGAAGPLRRASHLDPRLALQHGQGHGCADARRPEAPNPQAVSSSLSSLSLNGLSSSRRQPLRVRARTLAARPVRASGGV